VDRGEVEVDRGEVEVDREEKGVYTGRNGHGRTKVEKRGKEVNRGEEASDRGEGELKTGGRNDAGRCCGYG
jgi:hypothetical protein